MIPRHKHTLNGWIISWLLASGMFLMFLWMLATLIAAVVWGWPPQWLGRLILPGALLMFVGLAWAFVTQLVEARNRILK